MRRITTLSILFFVSINLLAQTPRVAYRVSDTEATYEPAGKELFYPGDSITVKQISLFDLRRYTRDSHLSIESQRIEYFSGTFEISDLYAMAERVKNKNLSLAIGGKDYSPGASTRPAGDKSMDESILAVVSSIQSFLSHPSIPDRSDALNVTHHDDIIEVNNSTGEDLFIDVIWVKDDRCFSAISYAKDYVSYNPLAANATRVIKVDRYANAETLFVVGSSSPVAYNTIKLSEYQIPQSKGAISGITFFITRAK